MSEDDAFIAVHRDRRAGFGGGGRWFSDGGTMRVGGLSNKGAGKALAGSSPLAGYSDIDTGGFPCKNRSADS